MAQFLWTTTNFLAAVRRSAMLPTNVTSIGTATSDIVAHASEVIQSQIFPAIVKTREEYGIKRARIAIATGTQRYRVPDRAFLNKLRHVALVDVDGNLKNLIRIELSDLEKAEVVTTGEKESYFMQENFVSLTGAPTAASGFLELDYLFRPSRLAENFREITAVNLVARTIDFASQSFGWATTDKFDIQTQRPGAEAKVWSLVATAVSATQITFSSATPIDGTTFGTSAVEVGDYVSIEGESAIPMIPIEFIPLLKTGTIIQWMLATGMAEGAKLNGAKYKEMAGELGIAIEDRVESDPQRFRGRGSPMTAFRGMQ